MAETYEWKKGEKKKKKKKITGMGEPSDRAGQREAGKTKNTLTSYEHSKPRDRLRDNLSTVNIRVTSFIAHVTWGVT